jgi:hypothetical protein
MVAGVQLLTNVHELLRATTKPPDAMLLVAPVRCGRLGHKRLEAWGRGDPVSVRHRQIRKVQRKNCCLERMGESLGQTNILVDQDRHHEAIMGSSASLPDRTTQASIPDGALES